jgi:AraC family transcriptional regulator
VDGGATRTAADARTAFAQSAGARPIYTIAERDGGLGAAKWKLDRFCAVTGESDDAILAFRTSGSSTVTRHAGGESVRKRPAIGSATFAAADRIVRWSSEGPSEALHIYIPPDRVRRFAERELSASSTPRIREFFAVTDPWLHGYLQLATSEFELCAGSDEWPDPLFLARTEYILLRHLLRWYSDSSVPHLDALARSRAPNPLRSGAMRRVQEYVEAHLAEDIRLQHLADLACMSVGHFLRSFRAASGMTPYQYVVEQRLQKARTTLASSAEAVSLVARRCGFKTPSRLSLQFHARFGVSPSSYRTAAGANASLDRERRAAD